MAEGKYYDESGDFDDRDFDDSANESQAGKNGETVDDGKNTAGFGKFGQKTNEDGNTSWGLLRKGEKEASKKPNVGGKGGDKTASLGEKENNVESDDDSTTSKFKNAVKGVKELQSGNVVKATGSLKKAGPLMAVIALCLGVGFGSFFGQMGMSFNLISLLQGNFDSLGVSNMSRNNKMLAWQLRPTTRNVSDQADDFVRKHSKIYQKFTGASEQYFTISKRQAKKFAKAGIRVMVDADSGEKVLEFKRPNGEASIVTADNFKSTLETDSDFAGAFEQGTKTWRKAVGDWFDTAAKAFLKKIDVYRNRFKDYVKGQDQEANRGKYEATVKEATGDGDIEGRTGDKVVDEVEEKDADDNVIKKRKIEAEGDGQLHLKRGAKAEDVKTALEGFSKSVGGKISKVATQIAQAGCMAAEIVGAINMLVLANEAVQILQVASTVFEGIQKAQVEDSISSPIHEIGNSLTQEKTTKYLTKDGEEVTKTGSAMSASAIAALFGNVATNQTDPSVNSFNLTDSINSVMKSVGSSMSAYRGCTIAKIGAGLVEAMLDAVDVATDLATVAACILGGLESFGATCLPLIGKILAKIAIGTLGSYALAAVVQGVVSFMVPKVVTMIARDLATNIGGEDFGNAIASGANMYMGQNHQFGGGSLASKETLGAYLQEQEKYVAEQARYERASRSPFDITSRHTFLGALIAKSIPLLTQTSSVTSGIANFSNTALVSLSSLSPNASAMTSAITAHEAAERTEHYCPELDSIGAVADPFCNPYFITDFDTMGSDPAEVVYRVANYGDGKNFDLSNEDEQVPTINENLDDSRLYQYIVYCGQRSASTFGMADQNVANAITNGGPSTLESTIPIWGGVADMLNSTKILDNFGYVSGEACVTKNGSELLGADVFTWDEARDYQRFIEDQRLAENMGLIEESSVSVAIRHYYEKNPIDDSFEGMLSYFSGMSKEKVSSTFDILDAAMWLAQYDPSDLYPIKDNEMVATETKDSVIDNNEEIETELFVTPKVLNISYKKEYLIG